MLSYAVVDAQVVTTIIPEDGHGQSTGHFGYEKTMEQVQRTAYWESWKMDVSSALAANHAMNSTEGGYPSKLYDMGNVMLQ